MNRTKIGLISMFALALPISVIAQEQAPAQPATPPTAAAQAVQGGAAAQGGAVASMPASESAATPAFGGLDADKDGRLSREEADKEARLKDAFASLDTDKDSFLSADEFMKLTPVAPR